MKNTSVPLVGGFYADDTRSWSAQDCVNWLPTQAEKEGTRTPSMLKTPPGLREFTIRYRLVLQGTYANAVISAPYTSSLSITGGVSPYSNPQVVSGSLPPGLSLSIVGDTLVLSGTTTSAHGSYPFTVSVDSTDGQTATSNQNITVVAFGAWDPSKISVGSNPAVTLSSNNQLATLPNSVVSYTTFGGTVGHSSGKWMFQGTFNGAYTPTDGYLGIGGTSGGNQPWVDGFKPSNSPYVNGEAIGLIFLSGFLRYSSQTLNSGSTNIGSTSAIAANVPITVLVDLDSTPHTIKYYNGNTLLISYNINAALNGIVWYPLGSMDSLGQTLFLNCGQQAITPPTGVTGYNPYWGII